MALPLAFHSGSARVASCFPIDCKIKPYVGRFTERMTSRARACIGLPRGLAWPSVPGTLAREVREDWPARDHLEEFAS